ncbi:hypothetical protein C8Q75DRAFT_308124 [Abortiporus biennis]|nr:hypothetical protein C8Q75DRAFT_308124 [Abortiporus biennis]
MPPRPSKVPDEYARRSVCRNHLKVYDGVARGSMRIHTWSNCEYRSMKYTCRYSHTIFNSKRILALGDGIIHLNYGYGFERYGAYENTRDGWDIEHNGVVLCSDGIGANFDLPKALLFAELQRGRTYKNAEPVLYEKKQTLCPAYQTGVCSYGSKCRFDHDLIDARRLEKLVHTTDLERGFDTFNFLTVECQISAGKSHWKITMKPDALQISSKNGQPIQTMPHIPTAPFSREGDDLLQVIRDLEMILAGEFSPGENTSNTDSNVNKVTSIPSASIFSTKPVTPAIVSNYCSNKTN